MAPKREGGADLVKRVRKVMSLEDKIKVLDALAKGRNNCAVARQFGVNESTIRSIKSCENAIRVSAASDTKSSLKMSYVPRDPNMVKMEAALSIWMEEESQKTLPACMHVIGNKAKEIYQNVAESSGTNPEKFQAGKGWFDNFKKRYSLPDVKLEGELTSTDHSAASKYSEELKKFIHEKGFKPEQVFNADETGLFWKRMPNHTILSKDATAAEVFKIVMDRLTLLFCANASGDFFVKPMLLYRCLHPHILKGKNLNHLPVFWRSNKTAWVTSAVFLDWFHNCFVHEVERYLRNKDLDFRALLILDSSPCHPEELQFAHPNIEVVFLPPNISSLLQPMDQGIIRKFKAYYTRYTLDHIADLLESKPQLSLKDAWNGYTIASSLGIIKESVSKLKQSTLNAAWVKIWREVVRDSDGVPTLDDEINIILESAKRLPFEGFDSIHFGEVVDLLDSHAQELTEEEQQELTSLASNDEDNLDIPVPAMKISLEAVSELLTLASKLSNKAMEMDPVMDRSLTFRKTVNDALKPYKQLYRDLQSRASQPVLHAFYGTVEKASPESLQ